MDENVMDLIHLPHKTELAPRQYQLVFLLVISWLHPGCWLLDNDTPGSGLAIPRGEDKPFSVTTEENYLVLNHIPKC